MIGGNVEIVQMDRALARPRGRERAIIVIEKAQNCWNRLREHLMIISCSGPINH
jgi:hypothetical protein